MMISSPIFSYVFHFNLVMILLLGIASETTSSDSGSIIKIREPGNLGASNYSIRLDWGEIIDATENKYSITVGTIVGFLPKIYGIYQTVSSLLYPGAPKKTFEDIIAKVNEEFTEVQKQLNTIEKKLTKKELEVYENVEKAVVAGMNDVQLKSSIGIELRAVTLYDELNILLNGMLGTTTVLPKLLDETLQDLYDCGTKSINDAMEKFITLVNVGAVCITYYDQAINDKDKFDGEDRIKRLSEKKDAAHKKLKEASNKCLFKYDRDTINNYISKVLTLMQNSDTTEVTRALYERFNDIYYQRGISWVFYAAWKFSPDDKRNAGVTHIQVQSAHGVCRPCRGYMGSITKGGWTIYWASEPQRDSPVQPIRGIDQAAVNWVVDNQKRQMPEHRFAKDIEKDFFREKDNFLVLPYSRSPFFWLFVVSPPNSATFGNPLNQQLNVVSYRRTTEWEFFHMVIPGIKFKRQVIVDVVVM